MEVEKVSSGSEIINQLLVGGFERDVITSIYGPAGSGKTCLCILASIEALQNNKKVLYIDTEGGFSVERMSQLTPKYKEFLSRMVFLTPTNFEEQMKAFERLKESIKDNVGIIIIDTISMLYRLELGKNDNNIHSINCELGRQISWLSEIARKKKIPVLITNQVYSDFDVKGKVNMVGGDILKYGSKCLIELQITPNRTRKIILKKHRSIKEEKEAEFRICQTGIVGVKEKKFRLF